MPEKVLTRQFGNPQRQSPAALVLILANLLKYIFRQMWPILLIYYFSSSDSFLVWITYIAIGGAVFSAVYSVFAYLRFYFHVTEDKLVMKQGVLGRTNLSIPFERIQTINFRETLLHKVLKVVSVEVETAGAEEKEFVVTALSRQEAEALRELLLRLKKASVESEKTEQEDGKHETTSEAATADKLLMKLNIQDLLKIGISSNHLQAAGLIVGSVTGLYFTIQDSLGEDYEDQVFTLVEMAFNTWYGVLVFGIPALLLAGFLLNLFRTVMRYYDLRFFQTHGGFKLQAGLVTRVEQSASLPKVQLVQWHDNPIYRKFKMVGILLKQASSNTVGQRSAISVPGCYDPELSTVKQLYFRDAGQMEILPKYSISKKIIYRRVLFTGVLPGLLLVLLTLSPLGYSAAFWLLLIPLQLWLSVIFHRNWKYVLHREALKTQFGIWNLRRLMLQWHKVQTVELVQSYYQRRHGLATLVLSTASGQVSIPYISLKAANEIQDYVLYKVEQSKKRWM